jgi:class 3 adenylate cyclase
VDVTAWLEGMGLGRCAQSFRDNDVDAEVLLRLTADDLTGLGVASIGHRRKLLDAIAGLAATDGAAPSASPVPTGPGTSRSGAAPRSREAERRQLTVMFADLVGSTALSARLDPEEMAGLLKCYHEAVTAAIGRFEGHVAKFASVLSVTTKDATGA